MLKMSGTSRHLWSIVFWSKELKLTLVPLDKACDDNSKQERNEEYFASKIHVRGI